MLLRDCDIRELSVGVDRVVFVDCNGFQTIHAIDQPLLYPYSEGVQEGGVISYGQTHGGYDLRLGFTALIFKNSHAERIDPKAFKQDKDYQARLFDTVKVEQGERIWIPPNGYILGYSLERIAMPPNLKGRCVGKSTLARAGVLVNTTPLEPGWQGHLTIEIANVTPCPVCLYAGEGCAQLEFECLTGTPKQNYGDKQGKYQSQGAEPVPSRVTKSSQGENIREV